MIGILGGDVMRRLWLIVMFLIGCLSVHAVGAKTPIQFMFWGPVGGEGDLWLEIVNEFNRTHPDVEVEPLHTPSGFENKLITMIAGGAPPDVFCLEEEPYATFVRGGVLLDLTERFRRDFDERRYNQVALRFLNYDGRYYALPWDLGVGILFHNVSLLESVGLTMPPVDFTWDVFLENAKKMTRDFDGDGRSDQWGFRVVSSFRSTSIYFIWGSGGDLVDDPVKPTRSTVTEPRALRGLQFVQDLVFQHGVAPALGTPQPSFVRGDLGMERNGAWNFANYRSQISDFEWDVTFFPRHPEIPQSGGYLGPDNIAISVDSPYPDQAWEFIKFVIGSKGQQMLASGGRSVPALSEAIRYFIRPDAPPRNDRVLLAGIEGYGRVVPRLADFRQMEQEWTPQNTAMLRGELSPEALAHRIKEITERYLGLGQ
jgi:multiple sugar transport system substrate-binding protein